MKVWPARDAKGGSHPADEALAALVLAGPDAAPEGLAAHVTGCETCARRLLAVERWLRDDRQRTAAGADRLFSTERLERQHDAIMRRIGGPAAARVLRFPVRRFARATPRRQVMRRSVAVAALLGLVVGTLMGRLLDPHTSALRPAASEETVVVQEEGLQASAGTEEAFLREFEAAVSKSSVGPLSTLDALTPRPADDRLAP